MPKKTEADDLITHGLDEFKRVSTGEAVEDNRKTYKEDLLFARQEEQWPAAVRKMREDEGRPILTINKLGAFGKQVVNDARQNKPSVKVHPADSEADPETAEIFNGIIRNIEVSSNAAAAYDTGIDCAVWGGFGYWRIGLDYAYDDSFDQDITIKRVANPLSVYGDPNSTEVDSCDWDVAFVTDWLSNTQFEAAYGDKAKVDWEKDDSWSNAKDWRDKDGVQIAEWWSRKTVDRPIVLLSDGQIRDKASLQNDQGLKALLATGTVKVKGERIAKSYQVTQRIMSGVEILKETLWLGKYIPIVPVYGDEYNIEGRRVLRSLIHPAVDAQRMFNYWRSVAAEVAAYTPRVPYIGPVGAFATDPNWPTANTKSHPYLEYDVVSGGVPPQRQSLDMGVAAGALQEALNASDDIKSTIGMYDASLGSRSNETSGKAINARKMEGDVATFNFPDNLTRAIRHTGIILIDLAPKVYNTERVIRIIGEDGKHSKVPLKQPVPVMDPNGQPQVDDQGAAITRIYDLGVGKYDLTVESGPNYTTKREEAIAGMTEALRAFPNGAPILIPLIAKNSDWHGADEVAEKFDAMAGGGQPQIPPEVQQAIDQSQQTIDDQAKQIADLKANTDADVAKVQSDETISREKIASNERISHDQIASDERVAMVRAGSDFRIAAKKAEDAAKVAANRPMASKGGSPNGI